MHDSMSNCCIDISVSRIGRGIDFNSHRKGEGVSLAVSRLGKGISVITKAASAGIGMNLHRVGNGIQFKCGLVCSVGRAAYLKVEPNVIWLLPDSAEVVVYSNVTWYIY